MTIQIDNSELYLARYCGPVVDGDRQRVEIRRKGRNRILADVSWKDFKELIRLGQLLIEKCNKEELEAQGVDPDYEAAQADRP